MNRKWTYIMMCLLILIMPLHYYICELFIKSTSIDNLFRDALIIILLVLYVRKSGLRIKKIGILIFINCAILVMYALISYLLWNYNSTFNILRTYIVPMLFFYISSMYRFDQEEFNKLQKLLIIEMAFISLYGVFQAYILGDQFAVKLGYDSLNGHLSSVSFYINGFWGYQRNTGTFVSPNICGAVLVAVLLVHLLDSEKYINKGRNLITFVLTVGAVASFSRSSIVGGVVALLFYMVVSNKFTRLGQKKLLIIPAVVIAVLLVQYVDQKVLNGLFSRMVKSSFYTTILGSDQSFQKHLTDLFEPLEIIISHPFGLGFGSNGPMAIAVTVGARNVESSLYLMMYEIGIIPAIMFFIPYVTTIVNTVRDKKYKYYVPAVICVLDLIIYLLLPSVQTFELLFYSYMYIGFYYNSTVREFYTIES